ncbi:arylsulfatase A-like enzyme [Lewinella aquimaris]|uniref:Arylsulfatase A-like enzyme n=1 Tax=Neolewinella aquimaris TaxID=1835722 RepID=A0A840E7K9_9BACT|nr:sulfatase-like hydrolase/transferase [Neolewinella aquimaris]MBB4078048.1 arylsulfatase A-like enzyme [Neolewinella aquimaris]
MLILVDDLGYGDVGFNGSKDIPTPQIDRLARSGVIFTDGYVSYPVCGPSRAGLITGRYQDRFGFARNPLFAPNDPDMGLPVAEETIAEVLQKVGYKSVAIGKWHLGAHRSQRPLVQGFDDFFGFLTGGHRYFPEEYVLQDEYEVKRQIDAYRTKLLRNEARVEETEYLTDALSREAVNYIEKYRNDPFFIYLAYNAPHGPLQATEQYLSRFPDIADKRRRTYAAMVGAVDDGVGRVLDQLEALHLEEQTLVVFLSDNGGPERSNGSDNGPLRGQKSDLLEGGVRVPYAMRWPGQIPSGQHYDEMVSSLDILATMVARQTGPAPNANPLDGTDLLPYLTGVRSGAPHDQLFWKKVDEEKHSIRRGNTKLISYQRGPELYALDKDLAEGNNLAPEQSATVDSLESAWKSWDEANHGPVFLGLRQDSLYNTLHPDRFERPKRP